MLLLQRTAIRCCVRSFTKKIVQSPYNAGDKRTHAFQAKVIQLFGNSSSHTDAMMQKEIRGLLMESDSMEPENLAFLMLKIGKGRRITIIDDNLTKQLLQFLQKSRMNSSCIGRAIQILLVLNDSKIQPFVDCFADKVDACKEFRPLHVSTAIYALHNQAPRRVAPLLARLATKLQQCQDSFDGERISGALYGLHNNKDSTVAEVRLLHSALAEKIQRTEAIFSPMELAMSLYSLRGMERTPEVEALLGALTIKVKSCPAPFDEGKHIAMVSALSSGSPSSRPLPSHCPSVPIYPSYMCPLQCLNGLQGMSSDVPVVQELVGALVVKVESSPAELNEIEIGMSLFGLQRMNTRAPEVEALLRCLIKKLAANNAPLTAQSVSNAFYGLQGMSAATSSDVCEVIRALDGKLATCPDEFHSQPIAMMLFGLRKCSSDRPEVRQVIARITDKLIGCPVPFSGQGISMCLYGLSSMSSVVPEVKELLLALADRITASQAAVLSGDGVGSALLGLKQMSSADVEVRTLLVALIPKIRASEDRLTAQNASNALYGLQGMNSQCVEVRGLLAALTVKVLSCEEPFNEQAVGMALFGLHNMTNTEENVKELLTAVLRLIPVAAQRKCGTQTASNALWGLRFMHLPEEWKQVLEHWLDALIAEVPRSGDVDKIRFVRGTIEFISSQKRGCPLYTTLEKFGLLGKLVNVLRLLQ